MADQLVNGRRAILQCLDSLLAEEKNIKLYKEAFQTRMDDEPLGFFKEFVMPLMPKEGLGMTSDDPENKTGQVTINFVPAVPKPKE